MDDASRMIPIEDVQFTKQTQALPASLVDRITLIHHAFRNYLGATLEETIDNFTYDQDPEREIRVWEHMASIILTLKYQQGWPDEKVAAAVKVVLGLSMGAIQGNTLDEASTQQIVTLWATEPSNNH